MYCEVCDRQITSDITICDHIKNGYCKLFLAEAKQDAITFNMKKDIITLAELKQNDTFRYIGSDENDWHTVILITEDKLFYPGYFADKPESNYRVDNVRVILKDI